mgnify:CR=1 FL=1
MTAIPVIIPKPKNLKSNYKNKDMILFLRDRDNNTIVDLDCYIDTGENNYRFIELQVLVDIRYYSKLLLDNLDSRDEIISVFSDMQELRGWLWERYFMGGDNDPEKHGDVMRYLKTLFKAVAERYDLRYVED